jgi:flotillin
MMIPLLIALIALALFIGFIVYIRLLEICPPNQVLIFYGKERRIPDGAGGTRMVGYRLVQGGRSMRTPLVERVARMDLTNMIIELRIAGAYCKGGIPLNVEGVANVKIASIEPIIGNAIERFLDRSREEIMKVARETLEGNLRGVLATMTPEEVNNDRVKFAENLLHEADNDLKALGLELDTLKIQNVSDDKGYLDSLGRKTTAEILKNSRIAEAENRATSMERNAENVRNQTIAKIDAHIAEARAEANRRIINTQTQRTAMVAEQKSVVFSAVARAQGELKVQEARLSQVRLQLLADQIKPAEAQKEQMEEQARGAAAYMIEEGKATAEALRALGETWSKSGDNARQIVIAQKLSSLIGHLMSTVGDVAIDKVTFIDRELANGDGSNLAVKAAVTSEQLKHTLGIDLPELFRRLGARPIDAPVVKPQK